jgi:hypothetical protein
LIRLSAPGRRWPGEVIAHEVFQQGRTRIRYHNSVWYEALKDRFNHLTALPVGWDGYGGRPVSFSCAVFAANVLEQLCDAELLPPQIVPGSDGTLQLEWHVAGVDVEIDILGPNEVVATRYDANLGLDDRYELSTDFRPLVSWIDDLRNRSRRS